LWHSSPERLAKRLNWHVDAESLAALQGDKPVVVFAPHFMGLDAGWTALTCAQVAPAAAKRPWVTIYTDQSNATMDAWIHAGRSRFAPGALCGRADGVAPVLKRLKAGGALYLLPDMDFGSEGTVFAPFFGVPAATVTSLGRFAKLARAQVLGLSARLTPEGYELRLHPIWADFPTGDDAANASRMNAELEAMMRQDPRLKLQYWWLHRRFKTTPPGATDRYANLG
jgi:Kdo2-lipid IVA lauroyltransferase/acyltransferase